MEQAASKKVCDRDMKNTPAAMASTLPLINFNRFSRAMLSKPSDPRKAPVPEVAMSQPMLSGPSCRTLRT